MIKQSTKGTFTRITIAFLLLTVFYLRAQLGVPISAAFRSSEKAIAQALESDQQVLASFETDGLIVAVIGGQGTDPQLLALKKKLGLWVVDFPSWRNVWKISTVRNNLYVPFLLNSEHSEIYLKTEDGSKIYPLTQEHVEQNYFLCVFQIPNYLDNTGNYQIIHSDAAGNTLNAKDSEHDFDVVNLSLLIGDEPHSLSYSPNMIMSYPDARADFLDTFIRAIETGTPIESTSFAGSKLPHTQKDLHAKTTLGTYIKVEGKDLAFRWNHTVDYQLKLNGYYEKILIRTERNYLNRGVSEHGVRGITSFSEVESICELVELFNLFFDIDGPADNDKKLP